MNILAIVGPITGVVGGLTGVGALIVSIMSYRYTKKQAKETEVIEELYGLALKVRTDVDAYLLLGPYTEL